MLFVKAMTNQFPRFYLIALGNYIEDLNKRGIFDYKFL